NSYVVVNGVLLILGIRAMIGLGDHKILLFVNFLLGNPWHQSYINCKLKQFRPWDLWPSAGVPITSSCWSRTSSTFRSLPLWRSAIYCQSSCFIPALQGTSVDIHFPLARSNDESKEIDYVKHMWRNKQDLKVEDASNALLYLASSAFVGFVLTKMEADILQLGKIEEEIDITVKNLNEKEEPIFFEGKRGKQNRDVKDYA
ncbi:hypothetical protein IFM89_007492, partial [Coptis chinensis]